MMHWRLTFPGWPEFAINPWQSQWPDR